MAEALRNTAVPVVGGFYTSIKHNCWDILIQGSQLILVAYANSNSKMLAFAEGLIAAGNAVVTIDSVRTAVAQERGIPGLSKDGIMD